MNIEKTASGKKLILSQSEWLQIGQKAGWHKDKPVVIAQEKAQEKAKEKKDLHREYWIALAKAEQDFESLRDLDPEASAEFEKQNPEAAAAAAKREFESR